MSFKIVYFTLVLVFHAPGGSITSVSLPPSYTTEEFCEYAGERAKENYEGPSVVSYVCVPTP